MDREMRLLGLFTTRTKQSGLIPSMHSIGGRMLEALLGEVGPAGVDGVVEAERPGR
jgi:hypothetical protein